MDYKKPQSTLVQGGAGIYPLTTADQVILADGSRLEKDGRISADSAANSAKLGGKAPEYYATTQSVSQLKDEKVDKSSVVNNFTTTQEGFVSDARALKDLNDRMGTPLHAVTSIYLTKNNDWNSVDPGMYYFNTWANEGGVNYPKGGMGVMMYIKSNDGTYRAQYCISDSWLGVRVFASSEWGAWKYIALA